MKMSEKEIEFLGKVVVHFKNIQALIEEYGFEDVAMGAMVVGLISSDDEESFPEFKSVASCSIEDENELEIVQDVIEDTFTKNIDSMKEEQSSKGKYAHIIKHIDLN